MIIRGILSVDAQLLGKGSSVNAELIGQSEASGKLTTRSGLDPYCDLTADGVPLADSSDNQIRALL